jgi:hydroxymethylpyrimidine pyrophosphatase-like HAD family hydrolase
VYFLALATDYDGTLASDGLVSPEAIKALEQFKETGRRLILVTGRELEHVREAFPRLDIFDRVVAENGAVIYDPVAKNEIVIGAAPPAAFVKRLRELPSGGRPGGETPDVSRWEGPNGRK